MVRLMALRSAVAGSIPGVVFHTAVIEDVLLGGALRRSSRAHRTAQFLRFTPYLLRSSPGCSLVVRLSLRVLVSRPQVAPGLDGSMLERSLEATTVRYKTRKPKPAIRSVVMCGHPPQSHLWKKLETLDGRRERQNVR